MRSVSEYSQGFLLVLVLAFTGVSGLDTISANGRPVYGVVLASNTSYFKLDMAPCLKSSVLNVEVENHLQANKTAGEGTTGKAQFLLMLNSEGIVPTVTRVDYDNWTLNEGTIADEKGLKLVRPYQILSATFSASHPASGAWLVGIYNSDWSSSALQFSVKAWCSATPACPKSCSGRGTCMANGRCRCVLNWADVDCNAEEPPFPTSMEVKSTLAPGGWLYYRLKVPHLRTKVLVDMKRTRGDPVLFLQPFGAGFVPEGLPTLLDIRAFADLTSFREHSDYHYKLNFSTGPLSYHVAVFNNNLNFEEEANFILSAKLVMAGSGRQLCPANCSYPGGTCVSDGTEDGARCQCHGNFSGSLCQGPLRVGYPAVPILDTINPGSWTYILFAASSAKNQKLNIKFNRSGGQAVLLAKKATFPTILNNDYIYTSPLELNGSHTNYFSSDGSIPKNTIYVFAIFNMDYFVHSSTTFELQVDSEARPKHAIGAVFIAIMITVSGSVFICLISLVVRGMLVHGRRQRAQERNPPDEDSGIDPEVVEAFPVMMYTDDVMAPAEDPQCAVCLQDYEVGEKLCCIPGCQHRFHLVCIGIWLRTHSTCPLCRTSLCDLHVIHGRFSRRRALVRSHTLSGASGDVPLQSMPPYALQRPPPPPLQGLVGPAGTSLDGSLQQSSRGTAPLSGDR